MLELPRTRDLIVLKKGASFPVALHPSVIASGWAGGQGLMWDDSPKDEFRVNASDGERGGGFALKGSNEDSDVLTGMSENQTVYGFVVLCSGSWLISTRIFERLTLASGRTVPITYTPGDKLLWSLTGKLTNEDEWTVSVDPRAPNENYVGHLVQAPVEGFITVQTTL